MIGINDKGDNGSEQAGFFVVQNDQKGEMTKGPAAVAAGPFFLVCLLFIFHV